VDSVERAPPATASASAFQAAGAMAADVARFRALTGVDFTHVSQRDILDILNAIDPQHRYESRRQRSNLLGDEFDYDDSSLLSSEGDGDSWQELAEGDEDSELAYHDGYVEVQVSGVALWPCPFSPSLAL
jgi:hypothetical protein